MIACKELGRAEASGRVGRGLSGLISVLRMGLDIVLNWVLNSVNLIYDKFYYDFPSDPALASFNLPVRNSP
jgi:hypothetical protein